MKKKSIKENKGLSATHYDNVAASIYEELKRRQGDKHRVALEKTWKEIDRQVEMEVRSDPNRKSWHPQFELPYQANALEILQADANDMRFPGNGQWFTCHAEMTNEYLENFQNDVSFLSGDDQELDRFQATQEDINSVIQGILIHTHKQYRFSDVINQIDAEAFKYGTYAAKLHAVKRHAFHNQLGGVTRSDTVLPVLVPVSIKNYYLDDIGDKALAQGLYVTPMHIMVSHQRAADVMIAAKNGKGDMASPEGKWLPKNVSDALEKCKSSDTVQIVTAEGDFLFDDNKGNEFFTPGLTITIACGGKIDKPTVIRVKENKESYQTMFSGTYLKNGISSYGTSPLMKGESLQMASQMAAESVIKVSALQAEPPISVNAQDPMFLARGIEVAPGELWDTMQQPIVNVIGDLTGSSAVLSMFTKQFEDTTGSHRTRFGAQTKSHQSAHAVQSEVSQGQSRTVKYIRNTETGFLLDVLYAETAMLRHTLDTPTAVFVPKYEGYVRLSKDAIPENLTIIVKGSSTPFEDEQKRLLRAQTMQGIVAFEPQRIQMGGTPLDMDKMVEMALEDVFPDSAVKQMFDVEGKQQQRVQQQQAAQNPEGAEGAPPAGPPVV